MHGGSVAERLVVSLDVSAVPNRPAGAGRYIAVLAEHLAARGDIDLVVWCRSDDATRWRQLLGSGATIRAEVPRSRPLRLLYERLVLGHRINALSPSVHHSPHYTLPGALRVASCVSIMDTTFFDHPELHEASKVPFFRSAIVRSARRATRLICISEFTADRLAEVVEVRVPITVARLGVDLERFTDHVQPSDLEVRADLGLDPSRRYVAFVSTLEPRKGIIELLEAFDATASAHPEVDLVLAGQPGWGSDAIEAAFARLAHPARVRRLGYVEDVALPALIRGAVALAYPSTAEGFGLPALEALACGTPLITTAGTVMESLVEGAAILVAPRSSPDLRAALEQLLGAGPDPALVAHGLDVARSHTWARCVDAHVAAYRAAVADAQGERRRSR